MIFTIAVLLAVFVLPSPWGLVAVVVGAAIEIAETGLFIWWSQRRKAAVGASALVGKRGVVVRDLWPEGQVKVNGELWRARAAGGAEAGTHVVVRAVDGLLLDVEPVGD